MEKKIPGVVDLSSHKENTQVLPSIQVSQLYQVFPSVGLSMMMRGKGFGYLLPCQDLSINKTVGYHSPASSPQSLFTQHVPSHYPFSFLPPVA